VECGKGISEMSSSEMSSSIRLAVTVVVAVLITAFAAAAQHPPIMLMDKDGEEINPIEGENTDQPFSIEQTCGMCHDYEEITSGYHFQMGWDVIDDDFGLDSKQPWNLSDGFLGKWYPYAFRQLAKKHNESADEIDLTVYDFIGFSAPGPGQLPCGACHPGGGGFQYDRDGNRYDEELADNPGLAEELDGDYYQSQWDKSGVVEADCFVCHLEGYNFDERTAQLEQGNYQWAVVGGSRIGIVSGSVKRGRTPEIVYNRRLFNEDGTISLNMSWPPPDDNCVYCHGESDVNKRGFSWNDIFNPDVHNQQGVSCTACHPAGPDHQIAKGDVNISTVADHLDSTMKGCAECHMTGYLGASVPKHNKIRPSHLATITCESCHIPQLGRSAALGHEATTGKLIFQSNPREAGGFGEKTVWNPVYQRRANHKIYPFNSVLTVWWGNRDSDGLIHPLFLREHAAGWELFEDQVTDDNDDGRVEVNSEAEIVAGLNAFTRTLEGNERFEQIHPVLVKGEKTYELDETGTLTSSPHEGISAVNFSISHNVAPARLALGANGCGDCHAPNAHFFKGQRTLDMYGEDGQPVVVRMGRAYGCNPTAFAINSFHQQIISPYVGVAIILVIFGIVVHYHSYGPKRITFDPYSQEVERFNLFERGVHLFRLIAFIILTVTGLILAFNLHLWQELLFSSANQLHHFHIWSGVVFIATTLFGMFLWFKDALFSSHDKEWVRRVGGYLGYKGEVPAGRFNAGQKMFYWYTTIFGALMAISGLILIFKGAFGMSTICITSTVHNLIGFVMIAGVMAHAYLGTIANPGTWRVLIDGSVTREWAQHHHINWFRELVRKGLVAPAKDKDKGKDEEEKNGSDQDDPDKQ